MNLSLLIRYFETLPRADPKKCGRRTKDAKQPGFVVDSEEIDKLKELLSHIDKYTTLLLGEKLVPASTFSGHPSKRRRLTRKVSSPGQVPVADSQDGGSEDRQFYEKQVTYQRVRAWRSRKYVQGTGAQSSQQLLQEATLPHTLDIDIKSCKFSILPQILKRLVLSDGDLWKPEIEHLEQLGSNREQICREELGIHEPQGKEILMKVFEGGQVPEKFQSNVYLKRHKHVGRWFRALAVTLLTDVYDALTDEP
eukprot:2630112-Karenia_brevis.AAC.1